MIEAINDNKIENIALTNYVLGNKNNSLKNYLMDLDSKINISSYTNNELKQFIEDNSNISFSKNKSKGKDFVNYNTFRKISGEVRTRKNIYETIQSCFKEIKEKSYAKKLEDEAMLEEKIAKENNDLANKLLLEENETLGVLEEKIAKENSDLANKLLLEEKKQMQDNYFVQGLKLDHFAKSLERYAKYCKLIDDSLDIKIKRVSSGEFELINPKIKSDKLKDTIIVYTDGKDMMSCSYDSNGEIKNKSGVFDLNDENIKDKILMNLPVLAGYGNDYGADSMLFALRESSKLAVQGNPKFSFEDLLKQHKSKMN